MAGTISSASLAEEEQKNLFAQQELAREQEARRKLDREAAAKRKAEEDARRAEEARLAEAERLAEAARLKALGFVAGIGEQLGPGNGIEGNKEAVSLVEQFRSAHGASGEVASQLKLALARGESAFSVPGIPGARGFGSIASSADANVVFPVGAYYYVVGFSAPTAGATTHAQLIAAAQRLYGRVRG